ncbi:glycoside hydrolase family 2 TIM barrel-domain containing protein [Pelagicoccus sp. SDUM812002]|uniref:glycoside hydrolase family 2 protein n=1 Tax=Pelagicoccus sp. SDUM812002 TaxID=3041266 RepID=UPI00280E2AE7|nr:glycoside hydrolase family 2 TIM barrel-domain containing protein [Pelagicoccus sp. SDUM812002]MDQ8184312.1 glycoside hydrolase family 2 TIM barrel-domain containing protein [Pelagicoccus sp. SDUM812002]
MKTPFLSYIPFLKALTLLLVAFFASTSAFGRDDNIANVYARGSQTLNGKWRVIVDPYENGFYNHRLQPYDATEPAYAGYFLDRTVTDRTALQEYDFDTAQMLTVPGDWNSQDDKLFYYEGSVWYRRTFDFDATEAQSRQFLHFGAVNYEAHVYLNGRKLGKHVGGFTPFQFEVTDRLQDGQNSLVLMVNNERHKDAVPTLNTDWWNYGGITRDVLLLETPETFVSDFNVTLDSTGEFIEITTQLEGSQLSQEITVEIPELSLSKSVEANAEGYAELRLPTPPDLQRWSPQSPKLYEVVVSSESDRTEDRIGFRTIEVDGRNILLNGEPIFLRGISIHEENPFRGGRAFGVEDAQLLLGWAKELGCNFARLAHYPHSEHMVRVADEMGILLWEEIPVYWTISWENEETLANARSQLKTLVNRDRNRASVIIWSMANETPISEARTMFLKRLVDDTRELDPTRLISAAMEVHSEPGKGDHKIVNDPFGAYTDILSFNQYVGWYDGLPEKIDRVTWEIGDEKPVIISEFGAGALQGKRGDALTRFSEDFQADLYSRTVEMLERIPGISGTTPWVLVDFRSPRRPLAGVQDGWNRKGLIGDNGVRKQAFYVLQDYYEKKKEKANKAKSESEDAP